MYMYIMEKYSDKSTAAVIILIPRDYEMYTESISLELDVWHKKVLIVFLVRLYLLTSLGIEIFLSKSFPYLIYI